MLGEFVYYVVIVGFIFGFWCVIRYRLVLSSTVCLVTLLALGVLYFRRRAGTYCTICVTIGVFLGLNAVRYNKGGRFYLFLCFDDDCVLIQDLQLY